MKPNNEHTRPDQRFFFPNGNEVEYHESFEATGLPALEILGGDCGYVVTADDDGHETANFITKHPEQLSGQRITMIVGVDRAAVGDGFLAPKTLEQDELYGVLATSERSIYLAREHDLLVVDAHFKREQFRTQLFESHGFKRTFVVPATEKLPFSNGTSTGDEHEEVTYDIQGVITSDLRLVGWPGSKSSHAARLLDLCIANEHVQNRIELGLLCDRLDSELLVGSVNACTVLKTYLEHFDIAYGTGYLPTAEPYERHGDLPRLNEQQREDYFALSALASNFRSEHRS